MKRIYHKWRRLIEIVGDFQAKIIFSLLYFLLMVPFGTFVSLFCDFLDYRRFPSWKKVEHGLDDLESMRKQ